MEQENSMRVFVLALVVSALAQPALARDGSQHQRRPSYDRADQGQWSWDDAWRDPRTARHRGRSSGDRFAQQIWSWNDRWHDPRTARHRGRSSGDRFAQQTWSWNDAWHDPRTARHRGRSSGDRFAQQTWSWNDRWHDPRTARHRGRSSGERFAQQTWSWNDRWRDPRTARHRGRSTDDRSVQQTWFWNDRRAEASGDRPNARSSRRERRAAARSTRQRHAESRAYAKADSAPPFAPSLHAPQTAIHTPAPAAARAFDGMIARHAQMNGLPESLVRRVIMRESRYNPRVVSRGNYGLMQIRLGTARTMGYRGTASGLLDAEINMTYAVRYLAGAYRAAGGNPDRAVSYYARGYHHAAKRRAFSPYETREQSAGWRGPYGSFASAERD